LPYEWLKFHGSAESGGKPKAEYQAGDFIKWLVPIREERGTSTERLVVDTANTKFISNYFDCGATSGDARANYTRLYITGAGGGGEAARLFCTVEDVRGATARGAHISLSFGATGSISGLGLAMGGTLHIPNQAFTGLPGTYAALQAEIFSDGANSDPVGMTELSFIRISNGGNSSGVADVDDDAFLMSIQGGAIGTGNLVEVAVDETSYSHNIRIRVGATELYLMCADDRD